MPSLYLVSPRGLPSCYHDTDSGWVSTPDLALVTIPALAPPHWTVRIAEESVEPIDFDADADFVGITGKAGQLSRMIDIAAEFRRRGKTVLVGGPLASLEPDALRPHTDILFTGELEDIAADFFVDLERGCWKSRYDGGQADITKSPTPRWDLYPMDRALTGALQTTRGCPFECEFCDVIQYQGRKQRHKTVAQVIAELDMLYAGGFRLTFLTDDNFTVHRQFANAMLEAIADWNRGKADDPMRFLTQGSLDIARDAELMRKCVGAGLSILFIGIETINQASLRETRKRQNLLMPMQDAVHAIASQGISIRAGIVVGFDHDGPGIFDDLFEFLQAAPLPDVSVSVLNAPFATPLYARMRREGRLLGDHWEPEMFRTNIVPKLMTRNDLTIGAETLVRRLFTATAFETRLNNAIDLCDRSAAHAAAPRIVGERWSFYMAVVRRIASRGAAEHRMVADAFRKSAGNPHALSMVTFALLHFDRVRRFLDALDASSLEGLQHLSTDCQSETVNAENW